MSIWLVKWNGRGKHHEGKVRDWSAVFDRGDPEWIYGRGVAHVQIGDVFIAWQTERKHAVGVCKVIGPAESTPEPRIRFQPSRRFTPPVDPREASGAAAKIATLFRQGDVRTFYPLSEEQAEALLVACGSTLAETR